MKRHILLLLLLSVLLGACSYTQKIRDGKTAFQVKQYAVATKMLEKEYSKSKTRVEKGKLAFLLGESYKQLHKSEESIRWYRIAYDNQYGVDALREYAYALKQTEQYKDAAQAFKDLGIEIGSPYEYRREMLAIQTAQGWKDIKNPEYRVSLPEFNTNYADYLPVLYKDNQLVFTSDRTASTGDDSYNWTGNKFSDLFVVDLQSNSVSAFDKRVNSEHNDGTAMFNKDYTEMYFVRCANEQKRDTSANCKIMRSEWQNGAWSEANALEFQQDGINYGDPSISADGKELYFTSNNPEGWGGHDIYTTQKTADGWSEPKILSRTINTIGDERFPYIDGDTLYFSSDFHPGMGGLDVFKVVKMQNGTWSSPFNLKPPVNSGGDDFGFVINKEAKRENGVLQVGYFTSSRANGIGNDDIYKFEKIIPPPAPIVEKPKTIEYKLILDVFVVEKIFEDPTNPNSRVLGRKPVTEAKLESKSGKDAKSFTTGEDGLVTIELQTSSDYNFLASKTAYFNNAAIFSTKGLGQDPDNPIQRFEVEIVLIKTIIGKEVRLENIYYDLDKANIRTDAEPTLNALAETLRLNPTVRIQLSSHTDCRASDAYNEDLSQRRAQSAVDFLISKGIEPSRLVAKGYGEGQPEANCGCARCTEDEHQLNRRTTFKILE